MSSILVNFAFEYIYAPKRLSDVVLPDDYAKETLQTYVQGFTLKPLLLYGPYGTGKTTIAELLPYAIVPDLQSFDVLLIKADGRKNIARQLAKIEAFASRVPFNERSIRFVIIDELDNLAPEIQSALKSHMSSYQNMVLFIFTTNFINKIDGGLCSRAEQVFIGPADTDRWLPRMTYILCKENVRVPAQEEFCRLARACNGDVRELLTTLQRYVLRYRASNAPKPTTPASVVIFPEGEGTTDAAAK